MSTKKATGARGQKSSPEGRLLEFFKDELKDIYWAENHIAKELPKMAMAATNKELKKSFQHHLRQTKGQIKRLERVFRKLGVKPVGKKCEAIAGITRECKSIIEETEAGTDTRDVGLILGAQKVEHYEISTYGGLSYVAEAMGLEEISKMLELTLTEERDTDNLLSKLAVFKINDKAVKEKKSGK